MKRYLCAILAAFVFGGCTPALHRAVKEGDVDRVRQLINDGADVNVREDRASELLHGGPRLQYTPLHWAAFLGDWEIAEMLIFAGADLNAEDPWYSTPLYLAAEQAHLDFARKLIAEGANVDVRSSMWGYTPLHRAAWGPVVRRYGPRAEKFGSDPNENYRAIISLLVSEGAEVNARDAEGETPLDQAIGGGTEQAVALLRSLGAKTGAELDAQGKIVGMRLRNHFIDSLQLRFREVPLPDEAKESPWSGHGADGGHPATILSSLDLFDRTGTYSFPSELLDGLGNPGLERVTLRKHGNLLDISMVNGDGAGGHFVLFQVNLPDYRARRFVREVIEDDMTKTHDWMPLKKRSKSWKKPEE